MSSDRGRSGGIAAPARARVFAASTVAGPLYGKLGDLYGRERRGRLPRSTAHPGIELRPAEAWLLGRLGDRAAIGRTALAAHLDVDEERLGDLAARPALRGLVVEDGGSG